MKVLVGRGMNIRVREHFCINISHSLIKERELIINHFSGKENLIITLSKDGAKGELFVITYCLSSEGGSQ